MKKLIIYIEQLNDLRGEISDIKFRIKKLQKRSRETAKDTVKASSHEFPYVQTSVTIEGVSSKLDKVISRKQRFLERKQLELEELEQNVTECIYATQLSSKERRVLTLYYIDRMTWQQVARKINETDEQVPRRIRNKIFERIQENEQTNNKSNGI